MAKRRGLRTRAVHAGEGPDPITGATTPSLVMSTTYALDEADTTFSALGLTEDLPYIYSRWSSPTVDRLEAKLADLEGAEAGLAFASGMAAVSSLFLHLLGKGDQLVVSDVGYAGTAELVRDTLPRMGIEVTPVDLSDLEELEGALRDSTRLVWAETPANPILRLTDLRAVAELAHQAGARLAVDSTFATPVASRPIELGADYVVHSLTKYLGGHGDALGGAVLGGAEALGELRQEGLIHLGGVLSPFNAWLVMRGLVTLPLRMAAHEEAALQVARFLEEHPRVTKVTYPGLPSHPQHDLAKRQMENFSGMLTFQVEDGWAMARRFVKRLEVFHYAVSLGHHRSLIFYLDTGRMQASSFRLDEEHLHRYRELAGDGIFRVSIGLEDPDDLCADLEQALG
jgi:cystathionine beta-lyase/cystathionine gamma-synthase